MIAVRLEEQGDFTAAIREYRSGADAGSVRCIHVSIFSSPTQPAVDTAIAIGPSAFLGASIPADLSTHWFTAVTQGSRTRMPHNPPTGLYVGYRA